MITTSDNVITIDHLPDFCSIGFCGVFVYFQQIRQQNFAGIIAAVRKARGTAKIKVPKGMQASSAKMLIPEAKAVAEFVASWR